MLEKWAVPSGGGRAPETHLFVWNLPKALSTLLRFRLKTEN